MLDAEWLPVVLVPEQGSCLSQFIGRAGLGEAMRHDVIDYRCFRPDVLQRATAAPFVSAQELLARLVPLAVVAALARSGAHASSLPLGDTAAPLHDAPCRVLRRPFIHGGGAFHRQRHAGLSGDTLLPTSFRASEQANDEDEVRHEALTRKARIANGDLVKIADCVRQIDCVSVLCTLQTSCRDIIARQRKEVRRDEVPEVPVRTQVPRLHTET